MHVDIQIERISSNKLNDDKLKQQVKEITSAADKRQQSNGVVGQHTKVVGPEQRPDGYFYSFKVRLSKDNFRSEAAAQKCLENGKKFVIRAAEARQWKVLGDAADVAERKIIAENRGVFKVGELTDEVMKEYFGGIYERAPHIRMIHRGIQAAVNSNWEERNHTLLYGQPAAAKTILFKRFKTWYESSAVDVERVAMVNSTTISKAGLETWLLEKARDGLLPNIICFDEIEKFNMDNLSCLLAVMDDQAKIMRTNAKIGKQEAETPVVIWATCNDIEKLKAFNNEALFSRFVKRYPCVRPSRQLMKEMIVDKINNRRKRGQKADIKWADAVINYAFDVAKNNDPRFISGLLDGEDDLLNGKYFEDLEAIKNAELISMNGDLNAKV
jgi:hypothetical protein